MNLSTRMWEQATKISVKKRSKFHITALVTTALLCESKKCENQYGAGKWPEGNIKEMFMHILVYGHSMEER